MNLTAKQIETIKNTFDTDSAAGYTISLLKVFQGYLMSSNEDLGQLDPGEITSTHYIILQVVTLLEALNPLVNVQEGGAV